ncbi:MULTISPECIES: outer membrane protein assembly factor BamB family protein [Streptomyces]|uniref:Outer membrane protein assembly factor BamB n=1 Tax=Streptomyces nymphaeiformis TaxID=2663842 RepID=A0A7W7XB65_9ACTN|nr:PQQ-binding-like beta-propeller repeat protein [Streptomyces nymphaeiformis]MBB4981692.1 outer membrane protein assembly factor BamB [Streptomyces nymphaeiformis]
MTYNSRSLDRAVDVPVSATPAVVPGAGVVVASDDGYVRFHNTDLSKVYWQRRLNSAVYASLVVDPDRRRILVAATSGLITCFDLRGTLVWATDIGRQVFATPAPMPAARILFVAAFGGRVFGLDLATGRILFERAVPQPWHTAHGGSAAHRDPYASPAVTAGGNAVVCCAEHVLCFAPDGTELWRRELGHSLKASPVALDTTGQVAVATVNGRVHFLDADTGGSRSCIDLSGKIVASPAVSGPVLAVGTQDGITTGIDIRNTKALWTSRLGAPRSYTSFSVLPSGDFIATFERGNVVCLRRDDGRFLWESSQVLGIPNHEPEMDITPAVGPDGHMYGASYTGALYHFLFRPRTEEDR